MPVSSPPCTVLARHESEEVRFALDSPVEGTGFEPSVPRERLVPSFSFTPTFPLVRVNRPDPIPKGLHHAGTDGSNPASGESRELRYTGGAPEPRTLPRLCRIRWRVSPSWGDAAEGDTWAALHMTENFAAFVSVVGALARHHGEAAHAGCARLHLPYELPVR